jgi:hypothetical protein
VLVPFVMFAVVLVVAALSVVLATIWVMRSLALKSRVPARVARAAAGMFWTPTAPGVPKGFGFLSR